MANKINVFANNNRTKSSIIEEQRRVIRSLLEENGELKNKTLEEILLAQVVAGNIEDYQEYTDGRITFRRRVST